MDSLLQLAIDWELEVQPLQKVCKYFPNLKKEGSMFLLVMEASELIEEELERSEKEDSIQNRFSKLYLIKIADMALWDIPPSVYAALQHLAQHVPTFG